MPRPPSHVGGIHRSLRTRADVLHTFASLLAPLAGGLVALGFYLLASAFLHPLEADSGSLLTASVMLSLGFVVLSYLLRSAMSRNRPSRLSSRSRLDLRDLPPAISIPRVAQPPEPDALPFHRTYIDPARIRR